MGGTSMGGVCVKERCECPGVCVYRGVLGMYNSGPRGRHPFPVNRITDVSKNITLPQTSFVGGNQEKVKVFDSLGLNSQAEIIDFFQYFFILLFFNIFFIYNIIQKVQNVQT